MRDAVQPERIVRFATFEVDLQNGELRKSGLKLKLTGQPFQVLAILLEQPGRVVTREELQKRLWPDTFVDVDHNLNTAINKIREVLGDSAENPRFVETLPRRGYRFIAPVTTTLEARNGVGNAHGDSASPQVNGTSDAQQAAPAPAETPFPNRWRKPIFVGVAICLVATATWYLRRPLPPPRISAYTQITFTGRHEDPIGTDGSRLFLCVDRQLQSITQVGVSGGEIAQIPVSIPYAELLDVSADGSELLLSSSDDLNHPGLWSFQIPGGSLRHLADFAAFSAAFSPDGKFVAYSPINGDIDVMRSDGTETRRLATGTNTTPLFTEKPSWSPDGRTIRFTRDHKLWEMLSDGSGLHPLLPGWHPSSWQCCGRWTPDGSFFLFLEQDAVFTSYPAIPPAQIWALDERRELIRRARTEPVQLTSGPIRWNAPVPSKDGKKIFARGVVLHGELVRFDSETRQLKPYFGGISADQIAFSADGKSVAYVTFPEGILWRANRDGSDPLQLTEPGLYPKFPSWSPDGTQLVFFDTNREGHTQGYILSSRGGTPQLLLPEDKNDQFDLNWSPDGRKIAFFSSDNLGGWERSATRILDLASHKVTTLPGNAYSPRWSPNGRLIVCLSFDSGLEVFDFQTQRWSILQTGVIWYPTWSRDGQFIYFLRSPEDPGVYRIRPSGGKAERVVDLEGFRYTGVFAAWMNLDPDDTPILLRDAGTDDIFALTLEEK